MKIDIPDVAAMEQLGGKLAKQARIGSTIFLQGELGTGKTTLVRGFLRGLGHTGIVKSPTYTLIEPYLFNGHKIYHFDLYRLNSTEELEAIGLRDYFDGQGICLLEWPEKAEDFLGTPDLWIGIEYLQAHRQVELVARTSSGSSIIKDIH